MAVQNDNTILKKADLKAYHERIAPMLGGTFMVSTNNSDYYSTDEKVVGVWTDGKPLYQRTMVKNYNDDFPTGSGVSIPLGDDTISNVDMVYVERFLVKLKNSSWLDFLAMGYYNGNPNFQNSKFPSVSINGSGNPGMFADSIGAIYKNDSTYGVTQSIVTICYTKTTDAAGSATTTPGAYDINFPNTWPANTEIYFGNGVYGYRKTGVHNIIEDDRTDTLITTLPVDPSGKFVSFGGSVAWKSSPSDANTYENTFPFDSPTQAGKPVSAQLVKVVSGGVYLRTWGNTTASGLPYDIWFTFTK